MAQPNADPGARAKAWRVFRRMQGVACLFATLLFAAAGVHAWRVLPDAGTGLKAAMILGFPGLYLLLSLLVPLAVPPARRWLKRYVWMSFTAGFGQSVVSVAVGLGLLALAGAFLYAQIGGAAHGGRYPSGAFSAFGAGLGILFAQALLARALEREPQVRQIIDG